MFDNDVMEAVYNLRPIDDAFFRFIADDSGAMEEIIRAALDDDGLVVDCTRHQVPVDFVGSRSIVADAVCHDSGGRAINVETMVLHNDDDLRRARYHLAVMTMNGAPKNSGFSDVPDVAVICLSDYDPFGHGRSCYTVEREVRETGERMSTGEVAVFANGAVRDQSLMSRVMRVMCDRDAVDDEACPRLSRRKTDLRTSEKARGEMAGSVQVLLDYARDEKFRGGYDQGLRQGLIEGESNMAYKAYKAGLINRLELEMLLEPVGTDGNEAGNARGADVSAAE